jgi:predicted O-methyltransferase YrrM
LTTGGTARAIAAETGYRLAMAIGAASVAARGGPSERPIAAALRATSLGRATAPEQLWIDRVDDHRRRLPHELGEDRDSIAGAAGMCGLLSMPPAWGRFLFHLVRRLRPGACLELGTGLGISAAYQAAALECNGTGQVLTVDVDEHAAVATDVFEALGLGHRAKVVIGPGEEALEQALAAGPFGLVVLDADHTEAATVAHFEAVLPHLRPGGVVVVDDIGWTAQMRSAWQRLRCHGQVRLAVGIRRVGVLSVAGPEPGR